MSHRAHRDGDGGYTYRGATIGHLSRPIDSYPWVVDFPTGETRDYPRLTDARDAIDTRLDTWGETWPTPRGHPMTTARTTWAERQAEHHRRNAERLRLEQSTETIPVRLHALRAKARSAVIETYVETWCTSSGVRYRKTAAQRQLDHVRCNLLCEILGEYLDQAPHSTRTSMWSVLQAEALADGQLLDDGRRFYVPAEADRDEVAKLPVRGYR